MYKLDLGSAIAMAPDCYKQFIFAHRDRFNGPVNRVVVNNILKETDSNAVLRRAKLKIPHTVFNISKLKSELSYRGNWYLEFKSKRDYTAFVLRWS